MEVLLNMHFQEPSEEHAMEMETECAICYTLLSNQILINRYQLEIRGHSLLPDRVCPNEKISFFMNLIHFRNSTAIVYFITHACWKCYNQIQQLNSLLIPFMETVLIVKHQ